MNAKLLRVICSAAVVVVVAVAGLLTFRTRQTTQQFEEAAGGSAVTAEANFQSIRATVTPRPAMLDTPNEIPGLTEHTKKIGRVCPAVRPIVGPYAAESFNDRIAAARSLGAHLTGDDVEALYAFLLRRDSESLLKNEILNQLRNQEVPPAGLTDTLIAVLRDRAQEHAMRHYALQHLAAWYEDATEADKEQIRQAFWSALSEMDSGISGTALLALWRLHDWHSEAERRKLGEASLALAGDAGCHELTRITAVQLCGQLSLRGAIPLATELAQTAESVPLRVAAIATLGDVGGIEDKAMLERIVKEETDIRLRTAARSALQRLQPITSIGQAVTGDLGKRAE
jgi:hypothetical protein